jgi:hypothetical protein
VATVRPDDSSSICERGPRAITGRSCQPNICRTRQARDAGLNQAVRRNREGFPDDFVLELTNQEVTRSRSQSVILKVRRGSNAKHLPLAFTEHGAIMAATVLNSPRAVQMTVFVVRAFVKMRESLLVNAVLAREVAALKTRMDSLDASTRKQFDQVFEAIPGLSGRGRHRSHNGMLTVAIPAEAAREAGAVEAAAVPETAAHPASIAIPVDKSASCRRSGPACRVSRKQAWAWCPVCTANLSGTTARHRRFRQACR